MPDVRLRDMMTTVSRFILILAICLLSSCASQVGDDARRSLHHDGGPHATAKPLSENETIETFTAEVVKVYWPGTRSMSRVFVLHRVGGGSPVSLEVPASHSIVKALFPGVRPSQVLYSKVNAAKKLPFLRVTVRKYSSRFEPIPHWTLVDWKGLK